MANIAHLLELAELLRWDDIRLAPEQFNKLNIEYPGIEYYQQATAFYTQAFNQGNLKEQSHALRGLCIMTMAQKGLSRGTFAKIAVSYPGTDPYQQVLILCLQGIQKKFRWSTNALKSYITGKGDGNYQHKQQHTDAVRDIIIPLLIKTKAKQINPLLLAFFRTKNIKHALCNLIKGNALLFDDQCLALLNNNYVIGQIINYDRLSGEVKEPGITQSSKSLIETFQIQEYFYRTKNWFNQLRERFLLRKEFNERGYGREISLETLRKFS